MLWLKVGSTNRDPSVTLGYYLDCVANLRGWENFNFTYWNFKADKIIMQLKLKIIHYWECIISMQLTKLMQINEWSVWSNSCGQH